MRFSTRRGLVLVALGLVLLSASACGPNAAATGTDGEVTRKVTTSLPKDPRLVVGDEAVTNANGTTLAVLSYKSPLKVAGASPERGFAFSGIEVRGCAGPDSEQSLMSLGPNAFVLRTTNGARIHPEGFSEDAKVKQPALESMNPFPGECDRGFVTFQTRRGERPELVVYEEEFVMKNPVAWKIPEGRRAS